jgi:hypothetical protein
MDWDSKVRDMRRIINELEMLAQQLEGRQRMLLGRSADELKLFVAELEPLLDDPAGEGAGVRELPEWLLNAPEREADEEETAD